MKDEEESKQKNVRERKKKKESKEKKNLTMKTASQATDINTTRKKNHMD